MRGVPTRTAPGGDRKLHLELLRILAIFFVVLNHNSAYGWYLQVPSLPLRLLGSGLSALIKTAVPLFFMVSGALLLPKEESLGALLRKRVLRYGLVLALFSLLAYLLALRQSGQPFSLYYYITRLYAFRFLDSYWFLYGYLGYLLSLPLLRRMARGMSDREFLYVFALGLVFQGMDLLTTFLFREELYAESSFTLIAINYTVFYPLLGYYLEHRLPARFQEKRGLLLSFGIALAALAAMVAATEVYCRRYGDWSTHGGEMFFWRLSFLVAGAMYLQAKALFAGRRVPKALQTVLVLLGSASFGVYLIQHWLLELSSGLAAAWAQALGVLPAALLQALLVCLAGTGITLLLKQLPGLKKLL